MTNSILVAPKMMCAKSLSTICVHLGDKWHSATWRTNGMMVKNNQLVCNTIHSCFLRICKMNSYTLLNLIGLVLFLLLFDKPNARQCLGDMTDLYTIQHLCFKYIYTYKHTHTVHIRGAQIFSEI